MQNRHRKYDVCKDENHVFEICEIPHCHPYFPRSTRLLLPAVNPLTSCRAGGDTGEDQRPPTPTLGAQPRHLLTTSWRSCGMNPRPAGTWSATLSGCSTTPVCGWIRSPPPFLPFLRKHPLCGRCLGLSHFAFPPFFCRPSTVNTHSFTNQPTISHPPNPATHGVAIPSHQRLLPITQLRKPNVVSFFPTSLIVSVFLKCSQVHYSLVFSYHWFFI